MSVSWLRCGVAVLGVTHLVLAGCGKRSSEAASVPEPAAESVVVKTATVRAGTLAEQVRVTGEIAALHQVDIYSKVNGIIISESAGEGREVRKDALLAEVLQDQPGMEYAPVKITATNDGVVTMDAVEIGTRVNTQRPVYTLSHLRRVHMVARVIESQLGKIPPGDTVPVEVEAYPGEQFAGRIAEISPVIDPMSRTASLKILLDNPGRRLKPGMSARAQLTVGSHEGLSVPLDAIVRTGAKRHVFKVADGRAWQVPVATGLVAGEYIEIRGALQAGDQVVIMGQNLLEEGTPVQVEPAGARPTSS